jgi:outer membrane protein TolC
MSRTGRVFSILCFCLCISGVVCAQEPAGEAAPLLTLDEAIRIAQENNRSIKNAILAASIAADRTAEARTYRFPSIDLYALGSQLLTPLDFRFEQGTFGNFPGIGRYRPPIQTFIRR